jgi:hypothetical protein
MKLLILLILYSKNILTESTNDFTYVDETRINQRKNWIHAMECFWVLAIVADLVIQCLPTYKTPPAILEKYGNELALNYP